MKSDKKKRGSNRIVIVTSDAEDAAVKQYRIRGWVAVLLSIIFCVAIGFLLGHTISAQDYVGHMQQKSDEIIAQQNVDIANLQLEKKHLEEEMEELRLTNEDLLQKNTLLSDTINSIVKNEEEMSARLEKMSIPTSLPLTRSASIVQATDGDPICVFNAPSGTTVIATAKGKVTEVDKDGAYGNKIVIDHGNGYVTVYKNKATPLVQVGDDVVQGSTLYLIDRKGTRFGYQIIKDGEYIDPLTMLEISG